MEPRIPALLPPQPGRVALALRNIERAYYRRMVGPDVLCVLELDPDPAVAHVIDASLPFTDVLRRMKSFLWRAL
jgi:hypothetical protein